MARIIGAVACSHTPTIGFAFDKNKQQDPVWAPIFEAFAPVPQWLADKKPIGCSLLAPACRAPARPLSPPDFDSGDNKQ